MVDLGEEEDKFENFMLPLASKSVQIDPELNSTCILYAAVCFLGTLDTIGNLFAVSSDSSVYANDEIKKPLIGIARDLRGLAFAFNTKASFMLLFDWLYP